MTRLVASLIMALAFFVTSMRAPEVTHADSGTMRVLGYPEASVSLFPGAPITVLLKTHRQTHMLCLGMASLADAYGIPVTLGVFHAIGVNLLAVTSRVPANVVPAEPPGGFMLYAGRCTAVAPEGNLGSVMVKVWPKDAADRSVG